MKAIAPSFRRNLLFQVLVLVTLTPGLVLYPVRVGANPQGANVVAGQVQFNGLGTPRLDINNLTNKGNGRAIINWQSFSIDRGEATYIHQGPQGFTLNRVISGNPTEIYGLLKAANGGVAVINPNRILVGEGGAVDVAGMLTMSTLDVSDKDFLNGGRDRYRGDTKEGVIVKQYGTVSSSGGDVVLLGNFLQNAGSVSAPAGTVAFGAGGDILVDTAGGASISVKSGGAGSGVGIENTGEVNAAAAELKAHGNVYALAIKNDGLVRASGYNFSGGRLSLSAGPQGRIVNTGNLSARNSDGSGGQIQISGGEVELGSAARALVRLTRQVPPGWSAATCR
jgi:filamentous hemagglutinin family protein